jgi:hypothetical protein
VAPTSLFTVTAARDAPALETITVTLPRGLRLARSRRGVTVNSAARKPNSLAFTDRVTRGTTITIKLRQAIASLRITLSLPALRQAGGLRPERPPARPVDQRDRRRRGQQRASGKDGHATMTSYPGPASAEIDAPIGRCREIVQALRRRAGLANGLERVDVLERDETGGDPSAKTPATPSSRTSTAACARRTSPPRRLTVTRLDCEDVDLMDMSWELEELSDHPDARRPTGQAVDPGGSLRRSLAVPK